MQYPRFGTFPCWGAILCSGFLCFLLLLLLLPSEDDRQTDSQTETKSQRTGRRERTNYLRVFLFFVLIVYSALVIRSHSWEVSSATDSNAPAETSLKQHYGL